MALKKVSLRQRIKETFNAGFNNNFQQFQLLNSLKMTWGVVKKKLYLKKIHNYKQFLSKGKSIFCIMSNIIPLQCKKRQKFKKNKPLQSYITNIALWLASNALTALDRTANFFHGKKKPYLTSFKNSISCFGFVSSYPVWLISTVK